MSLNCIHTSAVQQSTRSTRGVWDGVYVQTASNPSLSNIFDSEPEYHDEDNENEKSDGWCKNLPSS